MSLNQTIIRGALLGVLAATLASCASTPEGQTGTAQAEAAKVDPAAAKKAALMSSFETSGQAGMDRLEQDHMQRICSEYEGRPVPAEDAKKIAADATAGVRFPEDGDFFGDWHNGEWIAKTGKGMQSNDDPSEPNGGNCYACHQMADEEIAYGTLGPPLRHYGKLRGTSEAILKYTWTRLWNSHVYNTCSHMPRFGESGILTEQQLKDVMAYLFDPASPVNQTLETAAMEQAQ
ncbi:MAG: sulfur oxidation c-type cytochrome SoxX [Xanthomonadales bacterium]|nr:sulfur oxidation c-type cytochrome SoxX [Xanthomonadales bacterium]